MMMILMMMMMILMMMMTLMMTMMMMLILLLMILMLMMLLVAALHHCWPSTSLSNALLLALALGVDLPDPVGVFGSSVMVTDDPEVIPVATGVNIGREDAMGIMRMWLSAWLPAGCGLAFWAVVTGAENGLNAGCLRAFCC